MRTQSTDFYGFHFDAADPVSTLARASRSQI